MMFSAGANSIFNGDQLLTTANPSFDKDTALFEKLGFQGKPAHVGPMVSKMELQGDVEIVKVVNGVQELNVKVEQHTVQERVKA